VLDIFVDFLEPKVHLLENILENLVDDISKDKCIVYVAGHTFILVAKERFPGARKGFHNLGRGDQDMRLHDNQICVAFCIFFLIFLALRLIVIHVKVELVCLVEGSDDSYGIHWCDPKLLRPFTLEGHPEKNGAFYKT
jgi:hypothetical protein